MVFRNLYTPSSEAAMLSALLPKILNSGVYEYWLAFAGLGAANEINPAAPAIPIPLSNKLRRESVFAIETFLYLENEI
jgi:hypothetical protein